MEHILRRDSKAALLLLHQLYTGGKDVGAVLGELSTLTRDFCCGVQPLKAVQRCSAADTIPPLWIGWNKTRRGNRLLYLASTLQKASADLYFSANRRMDAELCLLRLCDESLCGDLTALEARIQRLEESAARGQILRSGTAAQAAPKTTPGAAVRSTHAPC